MSNSDEVRVSLIEEIVPGTTPPTPTMLVLPTTGQSMQDLVRYVESQTIRSNRNVADASRVSRSSGGGLPCELRWASNTEALFYGMRATLCALSEAAETTKTAATTVSGTKNITTGDGSPWADAGVKLYDMVRLEAGTLPADALNTYGIVVAFPSVDVATIQRAGNFTTNATGVTVRRGARMDNGSTHRHFSTEVSRLDIGKHYLLRKQVFNTADINIAAGSISTINFGLTGGLTARSDTAVGTAYTNPTNRPVMDSVSVPYLMVGGGEYEVASFSIGINNNAVAREKVGTDSVGTIRRGQFRAQGSAEWYFDGFTELDKFIGNQDTSIGVVQEDISHAAWTCVIPAAKWTQVSTPTNGPNTDDIFQGQWLGKECSDGWTMRVQRFSAL